eukprot:TRINITY_DN1891_c0_g1_i1.p1 TRINITY_DN1891_c0_g1~~TRINITY_DN1891_c0_g1_i1.p1  ORF type:complete len:276 (+),score=37.65 TRINITY_DN1891_c0_g1_i1:46-828(+)
MNSNVRIAESILQMLDSKRTCDNVESAEDYGQPFGCGGLPHPMYSRGMSFHHQDYGQEINLPPPQMANFSGLNHVMNQSMEGNRGLMQERTVNYTGTPEPMNEPGQNSDLVMLPKSYLSKIKQISPPCMSNSEIPMVCQCPYVCCPVTDTQQKIDDYLKNHQPQINTREQMIKREKDGLIDIEDLKSRSNTAEDIVRKSGIKKNKTNKTPTTWKKMDLELFRKMVAYEQEHPNVKQADLQRLFNVNRSTYWRWKKKYNMA